MSLAQACHGRRVKGLLSCHLAPLAPTFFTPLSVGRGIFFGGLSARRGPHRVLGWGLGNDRGLGLWGEGPDQGQCKNL
jgi:hypothetical protein